ncbi:MAG: GNAT family N-acetyltransferase [Candidatus Alcyoniella australis]|nr:GNAT family N-acetyltransferase [Candidatus Alcyoniella australis]
MPDQAQSNIKIVPARRRDLDTVLQMVLTLVRELEPLNRMEPLLPNHHRIGERYIRRVIEDDRHNFLLAVDDERSVGLSEFRVRQSIEPAAPLVYGYITWFYVHPDFRQLGVGRRLLDATRRRLRQLGAQQMRLGALALNQGAVEFWRRMGFDPGVITMFNKLD